MAKEVSDIVEVKGEARLTSFETNDKKRHYQAKSEEGARQLQFWRNFENELGEMAAKAGYRAGDLFGYKIIIEKK